jgi:parallel beta-helix repeat protein
MVDFPYVIEGNANNNDYFPLTRPYLPHIPIWIHKNSDFSTLGFPGQGTINNPYIIEGYYIVNDSWHLIDIHHTTAHFIIRNCLLNPLNASYIGISLINATFGIIEDNLILNGSTGISLINSVYNITILNNTIHTHSMRGIVLQDSWSGGSKVANNTVSYNTIYNTTIGIALLTNSSNNIITDNYVYNNSDVGIYVALSFDNFIKNNTLQNNYLFLSNSSNNILVGNMVSNGGVNGIQLSFSSYNNTVVNNTIFQMYNGIDLDYASWNNSIVGNTIFKNSNCGIFLSAVYDITITDNFIYNNSNDGIYFGSCNNSNISYNNVYNNSQHGINLWNSTDVIVSNNTILTNSKEGIRLQSTVYITVINNTISGNNIYGLAIFYSNHSCIIDNKIVDNHDHGIWVIDSSTYNTILGNNISFNAKYGIYFKGVTVVYNTIENNTIYYNGECGILFEHVYHNRIINNTIYNHPANGIQIWSTGAFFNLNNTITNNSIISSLRGIYLTDNDNSLIRGNDLFNNTYGIMISDSNTILIENNTFHDGANYAIYIESSVYNNIIIWNDFSNNNLGGGSQAFDAGVNNNFTHNYWSEWTTPDLDLDGIVDVEYLIDGGTNSDPFPLTLSISQPHQLSIPVIISPNGGEILHGTVRITWTEANDTLQHSVTYTIYYSMNAGTTWVLIVSNYALTSYNWNTLDLINSSYYQIRVNATCSEGLMTYDISDATFTIQNPPIHSPIQVSQNSDFETLGFLGSGTESNPYIIEGLYITNSSMFLIDIQDTTAYFVIRDNILDGINGEFTGIYFVNVEHGSIENNSIYNCENGIYLQTSFYNYISNNTIRFNKANGIFLLNSDDNIISNNSIYGNGETGTGNGIGAAVDPSLSIHVSNRGNGIFLDPADDNVIVNNRIFENVENGVYLYQSDDTIIANNTINNNGANGIYLNNSNMNTISNNSIYENGETGTGNGIGAAVDPSLSIHVSNRGNGIFLDPAEDNIISNNEIYDNVGNGIYILESETTQIFNNWILGNGLNGIFLELSNLNTIFNNFISGFSLRSQTGIGSSVDSMMAHQTSNRGNGIFLKISNENNISSNKISNNTNYGIVIDEGSSDNVIEWNDFFGNSLDETSQAFDDGSNNKFVYNYWDDHDNSDTNGDGVADSRYKIDGAANNYDQSPMATPEGSLIEPIPTLDLFLLLLLGLLIISLSGITLAIIYRKRLRAWIRKRSHKRYVREYDSLVDQAEELARTWERDLRD